MIAMPSYTVYKICPYYIDENKKSISCEDVCRSFRSVKAKYKWMNKYCDTWEWEKCRWAMDISEAYRKYEKGDLMALDEEKMKALDKENKYLRTRLGKLDKRNQELYEKWKKADEELSSFRSNAADEISAMAQIYEQRICYLIDRYSPEGVEEKDVEAWAADREFALVADISGEDKFISWKVAFKEDDTEGISEDDRSETQISQ